MICARPLLVVLVFLLSACSVRDPEELELLKKEDQKFSELVKQKDSTDAEIAQLKKESAGIKADTESKVAELRASYNREAGRIGGEVRILESRLRESRGRYEKAAEELERTVQAKERRLAELKTAFKDLGEVLKKRGPLNLSADESKNWEKKKKDLRKEIDELDSEIRRYRFEITLNKKKLKYL